MADLSPASSPGDASTSSASKPRPAASGIRRRISASPGVRAPSSRVDGDDGVAGVVLAWNSAASSGASSRSANQRSLISSTRRRRWRQEPLGSAPRREALSAQALLRRARRQRGGPLLVVQKPSPMASELRDPIRASGSKNTVGRAGPDLLGRARSARDRPWVRLPAGGRGEPRPQRKNGAVRPPGAERRQEAHGNPVSPCSS